MRTEFQILESVYITRAFKNFALYDIVKTIMNMPRVEFR